MADNGDEEAALGDANTRAGRRSSIFRSLANRNYRLWAAGSLVSNVGTWMQRTALAVVFFVPAVPARNLLATSSVIAIVVGLALQSTLTDLFSGIAVGAARPYHLGDALWVEGGISGRVTHINCGRRMCRPART